MFDLFAFSSFTYTQADDFPHCILFFSWTKTTTTSTTTTMMMMVKNKNWVKFPFAVFLWDWVNKNTLWDYGDEKLHWNFNKIIFICDSMNFIVSQKKMSSSTNQPSTCIQILRERERRNKSNKHKLETEIFLLIYLSYGKKWEKAKLINL